PTGYQMGLFVKADSGRFHAWNVVEITTGIGNWGDDFKAPLTGWTEGDNGYGLGTPAATPCLISVASHLAKYKMGAATRGGEISDFSSAGPNVDGSVKPEISAPGSNVVSAISSFTTRYNGSYTQTITFKERSYGFAALNGTSMASPFVTGIVALMLQANPYLTADEVKEIITSTAYQDYDTRLSGETRFGYGKANAYGAVVEALKRNGTQPFSPAENKYRAYPNPTADICHVSCVNNGEQVSAQLYDLQGRMLRSYQWGQGVQSISLQDLPQGMYLLRLFDGKTSTTLKVVKN
ncbi:MAG: S8 family peptidase, partial [Bacteroidales bacterium]|nr:S8 family peptidase [Bacteroidales bacterium]